MRNPLSQKNGACARSENRHSFPDKGNKRIAHPQFVKQFRLNRAFPSRKNEGIEFPSQIIGLTKLNPRHSKPIEHRLVFGKSALHG